MSNPICQANPIQLTTQKYQCFVLCRNNPIPINPPTAPPKKENPSNIFSEMRHAPRFARPLSAPYKIKVTMEITTKATI